MDGRALEVAWHRLRGLALQQNPGSDTVSAAEAWRSPEQMRAELLEKQPSAGVQIEQLTLGFAAFGSTVIRLVSD